MTISVNNAIYAVLFLILAFFSSMCILFLLNVDYLALMFILIYVGAITILFLFVVMMLKIKINEKNTTKFISFIKNTIIYFPATERPVAITVGLPIELSGKVKSSPTTVICFNKSKKFPATVI